MQWPFARLVPILILAQLAVGHIIFQVQWTYGLANGRWAWYVIQGAVALACNTVYNGRLAGNTGCSGPVTGWHVLQGAVALMAGVTCNTGCSGPRTGWHVRQGIIARGHVGHVV